MTMITNMNPQIFKIENEFDIAKAVLEAGKLAKQIGFTTGMQNKIAIAVSELAKNIFQHATKGNVTLILITQGNQKGIEICAEDHGPGIENIEKALTEHYSTKKSLGLGLPAVKRIADEFNIATTAGKGTSIKIRKWLSHGKS